MVASAPRKQDLLGIFARHKVAANLLMAVMIMAGLGALAKINTQFFPSFNLDIVTVRVVWTGAAAEDVESGITAPLERELRTTDDLRRLTSTSSDGVASIVLEFEEGTDIDAALSDVKERVALVRDLPASAEDPQVNRAVHYEVVGRVLVSGPRDAGELRHLVRRFERELLGRGIAKIDITGLPEEEIAIQVSSAQLQTLGLTLDQAAARIAQLSRDLPAGVLGREEAARQLRSLEQRRTELEFASLPLVASAEGVRVSLGDVATIERRPRQEGSVHVSRDGQPAVEMVLQRAAHADSLESAEILAQWLGETRARLPPGVQIREFDQQWELIEERIMLLIKNGASGLALVMLILFVFLRAPVAWWVTLGVPTAFLATLGILYAVGGSINMISLFAMIMALGIIVDDAIVVGEDAMTHYERGEAGLTAAEGGARRMFVPVVSSALTTIAAFLPLMLVGGIMGKIMFDIPLVMICVLIASLVECFLILPGHLRASLVRLGHAPPRGLRRRLDAAFERFRDRLFRPVVTAAVQRRAVTLAATFSVVVIAAGLLAGGRIGFNFFPTPEANILYANVAFQPGTPPARVQAALDGMQRALKETDEALGGGLVRSHVAYRGSAVIAGTEFPRRGDRLGSIMVELTPSDHREVRTDRFVDEWRARIAEPAGLESLVVSARRGGPPGRDVDVVLTGEDAGRVKAAALETVRALSAMPGLRAVEEDMAYGQEQWIYSLTPAGEAQGLTIEGVGRQLRAAYDGQLVQIYQDRGEEVEVRVVLPGAERDRPMGLASLPIALPGGGSAPLATVVELGSRRGFEALRHEGAELAAHVSAEVDRAVNNSNDVLAALERDVFPELRSRYGVETSFSGRARDQAETLADMKLGMFFGLALIYVVLAGAFGSYGWPLVVMTAIPFGIVGALVGHWAMGLDLTLLSLFGLFALSGIVVNDSIILVTFYKGLRDRGLSVRDALIDAACLRLRAVLLTSLTTIGGLAPLLFEESLQAQFLIPMAATLCFGLAFSTVLVLLVVPTLLSLHESLAARFGRRTRPRTAAESQGGAPPA